MESAGNAGATARDDAKRWIKLAVAGRMGKVAPSEG